MNEVFNKMQIVRVNQHRCNYGWRKGSDYNLSHLLPKPLIPIKGL